MCKTKERNIDINTENKKENEKEKYGISCFLVPIETKGLSFGANEKYARESSFLSFNFIFFILFALFVLFVVFIYFVLNN